MSKPILFHDQRLAGREILWIELTRESKSNALSLELLEAATSAVTVAPGRAVFISSRGETFSAGLDLREMLELGSAEPLIEALSALYDALARHPSPTACLVEQKAVAGGVGLALCADAVVMSCHAWFSLPPARRYRPLAKLLFPIVQARRRITEEEFSSWFGAKVTAAELAAKRHIDRIIHHEPGAPVIEEMKAAAIDVLHGKRLYEKADLADRFTPPVRDAQRALIDAAVTASRLPPFLQTLKRLFKLDDHRNVFVVYGRNHAARDAMFEFLESLELNPLKWCDVADATGEGSPYVGTVLETGFAMAQAMVVLLTGDDRAQLSPAFVKPTDPGYERNPTPQARPNVLVEAGMALAIDARHTIIVQFGRLRPVSDLSGRLLVTMDGSVEKRRELIGRLKAVGCDVNDQDERWKRAGDFRRI